MKQSRKERKYMKQMKKDMAKGFGMKRKELFGSKAPQSNAILAIDYYKEREKERIKQAREWVESYIKEKYPMFKDLKFNWGED